VSPAGCLEKKDLVDRIIQAREARAKSRKSGEPFIEKINGLRCIVMETDPKPEILMFVFHGFGANAENLADVGKVLLRQGKTKETKIKMIFANAPYQLDGDSWAWWPLDLQALMHKMFTAGVQGLFKDSKPKEFDSTCKTAQELVTNEAKRLNIDFSKVILCGFSQGSWLATQVALHTPSMPGALVVYSGGLYCDEWAKKAEEKKGMTVLQFHGTQDMIVPFQQGQMLNKALEKAGCECEFHPFQGPHTIPQEGISKLDKLVCQMAS